MRGLIVDNGSKHLRLLREAFRDADVIVVHWDDLKNFQTDGFDFAVLSGSGGFPVVGNERKLADELALIRSGALPILGICYGFEMIVSAFGGSLKRLDHKQKGEQELRIVVQDPIFSGIDRLVAHEGHRWIAETLPDDLVLLAESSSGIEAVKHRERLIYGLQFHPEKSATQGRRIMENFMALVASGV